MQPVFDRSTPVVDFGDTASPRSWGARQWILWPVYAYKVLIPSRGNPPFNVFQRVVLDMCQAGIHDPEQIAKRLGFISPDLFVSVLNQLQSIDALDSHFALTEHAKRLLADQADVPDVEDVGYVFVDAYSRHLWPRMHRGGLPLISADMDKFRPELRRGDEGSPEIVKATELRPAQSALPNEPSAFDVQKAARHHARRVRAFEREKSQSGNSSRAADRLIAQKVKLLGTEPELVYFAAAIFMRKDARQSSWFVTDPCGLGVSEVLRAGILKLANEGENDVKKMLEQLAGQAWHVDNDDLALYLVEVNRRAASRVAEHLGEAASLLPPKVIEQLARADEKSQSKKTKDIETFYSDVYAAIEGTFSWLVTLHPDISVLAALAPESSDNKHLLRQIAERLGFITSDKTNIFFNISRRVVNGALRYRNTNLPGCLAAALLAANVSSQHSLATLAVRNPNALILLAECKKRRDNAGHYTSADLATDPVQLRNDLFNLFRNLVGTDAANNLATGKGVSWGADISLRIRSQAVQGIEKAYPGVDEHPDIHSRMIEMREAFLVVDLLSRSWVDAQDILKARLCALMFASTIVMEAIFAALEKEAPSLTSVAQEISDDRNKNATLLVEAASGLGFQLDKEGKLTQELTHTKPESIRLAAYGKVKSLQATIAAQVLSANQQKDHPLRDIARNCPCFLLHLGQLVEARGHGDDVSVSAAEAQEIVKLIETDIRLVLEVIY
ncbi:hypothetical protein [Rhodoferax antarcticus]|uniref:hypothetical protein n=1 Tax=Rhodoferax antarcticus TaxID=81479 RepID=UPI0022259CEC|nr:hypothetical protein [Rhodoferax antarcticus]MCW2311422.1 hypothetical protein [Rhodoferax antarcticus]